MCADCSDFYCWCFQQVRCVETPTNSSNCHVVLLRCAYKQPAGTGEKPVPRLCHRWDKSPAGLLCTSEMTGGCLKQLMVTQRLATGDTNKCTDTHNVLICTDQNQRIRELRAQTAAFNLGALWAHKAGK